MNKIKISNRQLSIITTIIVVGPTTVSFSSPVAALAKQDAWLSAIFTMIVGLPVIWINTYLGGLYPEKTFIEIIQLLLGKWIGGFVSINFILMSFIVAARAVWYVGNFYTTEYFQEASPYLVNILFVASVAIALLYGLEAMSRAVTIFFSITVSMFLLTMVFSTPNMKVDNLLPILEQGIAPVLKGSIPISTYSVFSMILLNMIYPVNINDTKKAKKSMFKGYLFGMFIVFFSISSCILVLGSTITANSRFPVFLRSKQINIGVILSRLEALTIIDWLLVLFITTYIYSYSTVIGISQLTKLKDYKKIVLPIGLIIAVFSNIISKNIPYQIAWATNVGFPYMVTFGFVLPVVLLIITIIRNRLGKSQKTKPVKGT